MLFLLAISFSKCLLYGSISDVNEQELIRLSRSAPAPVQPPPPRYRGRLSSRPAAHPPLGGDDGGCPDDDDVQVSLTSVTVSSPTAPPPPDLEAVMAGDAALEPHHLIISCSSDNITDPESSLEKTSVKNI